MATEIFESEKKPFQAAAAMCDVLDELLQQQSFKEAVGVIEKAREMYSKLDGYGHKVDMMGLVYVIVCLRASDVVGAEEQLDKFSNSDEYKMADSMVQTWKAHDPTAFEAAKTDFGGKLALSNAGLFALRDLHMGVQGDDDD